jgi:hypothetical protein
MLEQNTQTKRNSRPARRKRLVAGAIALTIAVCPSAGQAQLLGTPLPNLGNVAPIVPQLPNVTGPVTRTIDDVRRTTDTLGNTLQQTVRDAVGRPRQDNLFGQDLNGARIVRDEVLALAPSDAGLAAARALGFEVSRDDRVPVMDMRMVTLRAPRGMTADQALSVLRGADPGGTYDYNHVYNPSGETVVTGAESTVTNAVSSGGTIGLVDSGIDLDHPALHGARIVTADVFGSEIAPATEHGTAIAALLVGDSGSYRGVMPGASLYAADIYGGMAAGGSADALVRGLAWVASKGVAVINVSLAGPPNRLVEAAVRALVARGYIIVAAVGNDGPATHVAYPAAYEGVIAVTSVDSERAIQVDANRGPQIAFAAFGVKVKAADLKKSYTAVTGTSFAAPLVAARFAREMARPDTADAARVSRLLESQAEDLGAPGRDPVFGYGYLDGMPQADRRLAGP